MNHIYRLIWSVSRRQLVPVCEFARSAGSGRSRGGGTRVRRAVGGTLRCIALGGALFGSVAAFATPTGGRITAGSGQISQLGNTTTIRQSSQNISLNWQNFDIAANQTVQFVQPGASAVAVNRVLGAGATQIFGHLDANGQVWLINPNGVLFGKNSQIDVGGLIASTLDLADAGGSSVKSFHGGGGGSIVNQGTIVTASGGYVALLGNNVGNEGVITAQLGTVALAAGSAATLTFSGDRLLQVQVDAGTLNALAANHGLLAADGGMVYMTAGAKDSLLASSVNNSGVIRAQTVESRGGTIVLSAGMNAGTVTVGGLIDASAATGSGGVISATAHDVAVSAGARIDATGETGGGKILVGGGWKGGEGVAQATNVTVASSAVLDASAMNAGNGGEIVVRSNTADAASTTRVYGTLLANAGASGGNGGRIETSGHWLDVTGIAARAAAPAGAAGEWLLDPYNVTIAATGSAVGGGTYAPTADSTISASSIANALDAGSSVTITTGTSGSSIGDIQVNSPIAMTSGNTNVTLTLQAADSIIVNQAISDTSGSGKLNVNLYADNDNGVHDGVGVVILNNSITTGGGSINFGTGSTMTVNNVANTLVGGDVYVGGSAAVDLTTTGGNVAVNGQLIIANNNGLNIDTTNGAAAAGNVAFSGTIDSGDTYALITSDGAVTWTNALALAKSGVGAAVGDTYLATITSRLENAVAGYQAGYAQSWLGAQRVFNIGTDNVWRWVAGPEGLQNNGQGLAFFTQNGSITGPGGYMNSGTPINGAYTNWNPGTPEPNNYGGTNLSQSGSGEWVLQFVGQQGQWNDLNPTSHNLPFVQETNLAPSPLTVSAGTSGTVTFGGAIGQNKPLASLTVTGQILGLNNSSTNIATTGPINLNGQVQINNVDYNVLVVTAPTVTTAYGSALALPGATYSGFKNGDTVGSLTQTATVSTSGSTNYISTAPIIASGAVDPNYYIIYNPGTLVVDPAPLTVTGTTVAAKTYDGTTAATLAGGSLSGAVSADLANLSLAQSGVFLSVNAGTGIAVTATDALGGSAAGNYTLSEPTGLNGTISPASLVIDGNLIALSKIYDATTNASLSGGSLAGVAPIDIGQLVLVGAFSSPNAGTNIPVTVSLTGRDPGNYVLTGVPSLNADISPAPLLATANPAVLAVGGVVPTLGGSLSGFVGGQDLSSLAAAGYRAVWTTIAGGTTAAGSYAIVGAFDDPNYAVVQSAVNASSLTAKVFLQPTTSTSGALVSTQVPASGLAVASLLDPGSAAGAPAGAVADSGGAASDTGSMNSDTGSVSADTGAVADSSSTASGGGTRALRRTKNAHTTRLGGRRLIVIDGGVNTDSVSGSTNKATK